MASNPNRRPYIQPNKRLDPSVALAPKIHVRVAPSLLEQIDAFAASKGVNRSKAIRQLAEVALKSLKAAS